jgi:hypothetical protein
MSDRTAGEQSGSLDLDSVTNVAAAVGLGIAEETLNVARDQPEGLFSSNQTGFATHPSFELADTPRDTASQVIGSAGHAADMLLPKTPIHPRSDSKGDQAGQALPFSSFPSVPAGVPKSCWSCATTPRIISHKPAS